jgi:Fe-S oxidoreductase
MKKAAGAEPTWNQVVGEGKAVIDEVVWSCVQCRACEEACPVNIEYVDKIVDMRQHLVQEASRFPSELNRAFKGLETQSNPWGMSPEERDAWAEGMDVPRMANTPNAEYLYYVGCGGSLDSNNKRSTQSFIKILKKAGVNFAILGKEELCNGETARRLGNEYLYQTMAEALVALLNKYQVKKILVNCPHCFNTLAKEYPEFGGNYEVIRAADMVNRLVAEGKVPMEGSFDKKVVYHDSCNYGRFNGVYDEPRQAIQSVPGLKLTEMEKSKSQGTCCGAGGGRMWMEEPKDQRVNIMRADQALEKKPDVIATSCPFCKIMLGSAVNEKGVNDKVQVMDVMEIVANQIKS